MHAGMGKKPLVRYDPNSYRNRLPTLGTFISSHKNKSNIDIGNPKYIFLTFCLVNRKQYKSVNRNTYTTPKILPISNQGTEIKCPFRN
jgi:hypothetical protein